MALISNDANVMDLSLLPSGNSSRPDTPSYTNCERLIRTTDDIRKFTNFVSRANYMIKSMHLDGFTAEEDPSLQDLNCRLPQYQNYLDMAVSEFNSLPYCDTPGCTDHNTPTQSPTKNNPENSEISEKAPVKRKENEDGFTSPPSRKLTKAQRVHSNPELRFNIELENRFAQLQDHQPVGNSSATATQTNAPPPKNSP
ncbi:hypothetical protein TNCT_462251, partial [Trichonephila clavata]